MQSQPGRRRRGALSARRAERQPERSAFWAEWDRRQKRGCLVVGIPCGVLALIFVALGILGSLAGSGTPAT
jgi:hypothetical protein